MLNCEQTKELSDEREEITEEKKEIMMMMTMVEQPPNSNSNNSNRQLQIHHATHMSKSLFQAFNSTDSSVVLEPPKNRYIQVSCHVNDK